MLMDLSGRTDGTLGEIRPSDEVRCGPVWVSPEELCEVRVDGIRLDLSATHRRMLAALLRARGRVLTRADLYEVAHHRRMKRGSRAIDVHVVRIRKALGSLGTHILTVPGVGYRVDVTELEGRDI